MRKQMNPMVEQRVELKFYGDGPFVTENGRRVRIDHIVFRMTKWSNDEVFATVDAYAKGRTLWNGRPAALRALRAAGYVVYAKDVTK